jgi:hypothetical protein
MQHFAICSNPECNYSAPLSVGGGLQFVLNHPNESSDSIKDIDSLLPKERYCELCGAALLFFCPHCKKGLFSSPNTKYCRHCSKEIKPSKYLMEGKERRSGKDRRSGVGRRKFNDPDYKGPERRSGQDRRSGEERASGTKEPRGRS